MKVTGLIYDVYLNIGERRVFICHLAENQVGFLSRMNMADLNKKSRTCILDGKQKYEFLKLCKRMKRRDLERLYIKAIAQEKK